METLFALISPMSPTWQAIQAVVVAVIASGGVVFGARYQANRKSPKREGIEDEQKFRGELRDDNAALRLEIRNLKIELVNKDKEIDDFRAKYYNLLYTREDKP